MVGRECLHQLFERQAGKTPEKIALVCGDATISYFELNQRADHIAAHLKAAGVGSGGFVAVFMDRSIDLVAALLAVLKTGAAYVPMDPAFPVERVKFMLSDTRAAVLLTQEHLASALPESSARVLLLEELLHKPPGANGHAVAELPADSLAYVIYTSGSTGTPKGVQIPHSALVNHALAMIDCYKLTRRDRVLQFASISFDVAAEEIFPTLLSGGTLVLHPQRASMTAFLEFVEQHALTVLNLPTSFWQEMVSEMERTRALLASSVRLLIVGNEKALVQTYESWRRLVGDRVEWVNAYGLTETTITSTVFRPGHTGLSGLGSGVVPIGRPIQNVRAYVLDSDLKPVPQGQSGELYIGGAGLAIGYQNLPELTRTRFLPDPFRQESGARMYKTGDLARALPDGTLEFLGRADEQVKIRGFRIEPAEIEAVLLKHPGVRQAAVVARELKLGENRLVAYVAATNAPKLLPELRQQLQKQLPDYMVPAGFVPLEALPLLPNGKVDRRRLPEPASDQANHDADYVPPGTLTEELLANIWCEVLGLDRVGANDNFFERGGHSLNVVQVSSRLREQIQLEVPMELFFTNQTLGAMAQSIEALLVQQLQEMPEEEAQRLNAGPESSGITGAFKGLVATVIASATWLMLRLCSIVNCPAAEFVAEVA